MAKHTQRTKNEQSDFYVSPDFAPNEQSDFYISPDCASNEMSPDDRAEVDDPDPNPLPGHVAVDQNRFCQDALCCLMAPVVFRCPNTGHQVQGWFADDGTDEGEMYEAITCTACKQLHSVSPRTGKVLGSDDD